MSKEPRQVRLFEIHGHKLSCYAIAKLCRANKTTFERRIKVQGYTVQQAVNSCGQISFNQLKELLS